MLYFGMILISIKSDIKKKRFCEIKNVRLWTGLLTMLYKLKTILLTVKHGANTNPIMMGCEKLLGKLKRIMHDMNIMSINEIAHLPIK